MRHVFAFFCKDITCNRIKRTKENFVVVAQVASIKFSHALGISRHFLNCKTKFLTLAEKTCKLVFHKGHFCCLICWVREQATNYLLKRRPDAQNHRHDYRSASRRCADESADCQESAGDVHRDHRVASRLCAHRTRERKFSIYWIERLLE